MLIFTHNNKEYAFDRNKLDLLEAIAIKKTLGMTVRGYQDGLNELDPEALQAMVWLAKKRAGEAVRIQDIRFDVYELCESMRSEEPPSSEQPDPTAGPLIPTGSNNGTIPSHGAHSISDPSLIT